MSTVSVPRPRRPGGPARRPVADTLWLSAAVDDYTVAPAPGREVLVGRNRPSVHLCLGEDDPAVSRCHVVLRYEDGRWWIRQVGRRAVWLGSGRRVWRRGDPVALERGFSSLVVHGLGDRVHVVEIAVADPDGWRRPRHGDVTLTDHQVDLTEEQLLALVAIGERYLREELHPRPRSWHDAAAVLADLAPERRLTPKRIEHLVRALRLQLSASGVHGLVAPDVDAPGEMLKHNLLTLLMASSSIGPADLVLLDGPGPDC